MKSKITIILIVGLITISYKNVNVKTSDSPDKTMSSYKTFNFIDFKIENPDNMPINQKNLQYLKNAFIRGMNENGFKQHLKADLLINTGIVLERVAQVKETDPRNDMYYSGQRNYKWERQEKVVGYSNQGSVTFDFVDAQENVLIWQASIDAILKDKEEKMQKRIDYGIEKMFKKFPE